MDCSLLDSSVHEILQARILEWAGDAWVGKIPWRRKWQPTLVFLPGKSHGQRSLLGYRPWGRRELDKTKRLNHKHNTCEGKLKYICIPFSLEIGLLIVWYGFFQVFFLCICIHGYELFVAECIFQKWSWQHFPSHVLFPNLATPHQVEVLSSALQPEHASLPASPRCDKSDVRWHPRLVIRNNIDSPWLSVRTRTSRPVSHTVRSLATLKPPCQRDRKDRLEKEKIIGFLNPTCLSVPTQVPDRWGSFHPNPCQSRTVWDLNEKATNH